MTSCGRPCCRSSSEKPGPARHHRPALPRRGSRPDRIEFPSTAALPEREAPRPSDESPKLRRVPAGAASRGPRPPRVGLGGPDEGPPRVAPPWRGRFPTNFRPGVPAPTGFLFFSPFPVSETSTAGKETSPSAAGESVSMLAILNLAPYPSASTESRTPRSSHARPTHPCCGTNGSDRASCPQNRPAQAAPQRTGAGAGCGSGHAGLGRGPDGCPGRTRSRARGPTGGSGSRAHRRSRYPRALRARPNPGATPRPPAAIAPFPAAPVLAPKKPGRFVPDPPNHPCPAAESAVRSADDPGPSTLRTGSA